MPKSKLVLVALGLLGTLALVISLAFVVGVGFLSSPGPTDSTIADNGQDPTERKDKPAKPGQVVGKDSVGQGPAKGISNFDGRDDKKAGGNIPTSGQTLLPVTLTPDSVTAGSTWKGTQTNRTGGYSTDYEVHVQERNGAKFKGYVFYGGVDRNRCEVEGEINGQTVIWREFVVGRPGYEMTLSGTLLGDAIQVTWTARFENGSTHEGDSELKLDKKVDTKPVDAKQDGFVPLFNGKDLTGWQVVMSPDNASWLVKNEVLYGTAKNPGFALLGTTQFFPGDFHLRMETMLTDGDPCHLQVGAGISVNHRITFELMDPGSRAAARRTEDG